MNNEERATLLSLPSWRDLLEVLEAVKRKHSSADIVCGMPRAEYYRKWTRRRDRDKAFGRSPG